MLCAWCFSWIQTPNGMGAPQLHYAAKQKYSTKSPPWPEAPEPSRTAKANSYGAKGACGHSASIGVSSRGKQQSWLVAAPWNPRA